VVIDDLERQARQQAFFHFSQNPQVYDGVEPTQGVRAIAVQLLHTPREYPDTVDAVSVLMQSSSSGSMEASDADAEAALELLCHLHSPYLVIDGVHESNDTNKVLITMYKICSNSDTSILTLGRPDIQLPRSVKINQAHPIIQIVTMEEADNISDVKSFIQQEFAAIEEAKLLGSASLPPESIDLVSRRAMGMLLWASLFVQYLNSRSLTPRDRLEFLRESLKFDGLDGLCGAILSKLKGRISKERVMAADIFKWIGAAIYPLTAGAIHTAIAISPGRRTFSPDYLVDFRSSLSVLSGALAEIDMFGRAAFIHLSVREYLASPRCRDFPEFSLEDIASTHDHLAIRLTHDIPPEPVRHLPEHADSSKSRDSAAQEFQDVAGSEHPNDYYGYIPNQTAAGMPSNVLCVNKLPMKMSIKELTDIFRGQLGFRAISLSEDDEGGIACLIEFDSTHHGVRAFHEVDISCKGNVKNSMLLSFGRSRHLLTDAIEPNLSPSSSHLALPPHPTEAP
jgi:hypothetical protein